MDIMSSFEDWLLIQNGELVLTDTQLDNTSLVKIQHFIGFDLGKAEKERLDRKEEERRAKVMASMKR